MSPCAFRPAALAAVPLILFAGAAGASCGSASCTLMTDRYAEGSAEPHRGFSFDLRVERVVQDRLRGSAPADAHHDDEEAPESARAARMRPLHGDGEGEGTEVERYTKNINTTLGLAYGFDESWSLQLRLPVIHRDHRHDLVDEADGELIEAETWRFTRLGDAQLLLRRAFASPESALSVALYGGLKLPTGPYRVANAEGVRAERSLQPGTGTTDVVLGGALRQALSPADALVGQASVTAALAERAGFKPGVRADLSGGWSHAFTPSFGSVVQLNLRYRGRDRGDEAEPDRSGSTTVDVSPGLTFSPSPGSTLYAYLQLPVHREVNGQQLVARYAFALGWTQEFR